VIPAFSLHSSATQPPALSRASLCKERGNGHPSSLFIMIPFASEPEAFRLLAPEIGFRISSGDHYRFF
jgi:hypothetical protein